MCGIVGYVGNGNEGLLRRMAGSLKHRGPDGEGFYVGEHSGLGHRRLSIIDVAGGAQPIFNEDKTIAVVFNGEIYNYQTLRNELLQKGHVFATETDTEVVAHLYEDFGKKAFARLNGMFAIALWDKRHNELVLARDPYGQKPLYWYQDDAIFVFGSEPKALLEYAGLPRQLDEFSAYQFFCFDYVPQPRTFWKGISKLESGKILTYRDGKTSLESYFKIDLTPIDPNDREVKNDLDVLLDAAVKDHLIADVPVGVFLSGGIDSSTIAYYAKKHAPAIKTFSIGFEEKSYDESGYAKEVANFLKTDHYHKQFKAQDVLEVFPKVIKKLDEPFGDPSLLPTFLLSCFAREGVTVALGGDGADELFYGYPNHRLARLVNKLPFLAVPHQLSSLKKMVSLLPISDDNLTLIYKITRLLETMPFSAKYRDFLLVGGYEGRVNTLFSKPVNTAALFNFSDDFLAGYSELSHSDTTALQFLRYYLTDNILYKVDRAAMYASLEVRAPFLDSRLSHFINHLPEKYKLHGSVTKYLLKQTMANKLPAAIINRSKKGFGIPLGSWLRGELREYMSEILSPDSLNRFGVIDPKIVGEYMKEHLEQKADHKKILWKLMVFQSWCLEQF